MRSFEMSDGCPVENPGDDQLITALCIAATIAERIAGSYRYPASWHTRKAAVADEVSTAIYDEAERIQQMGVEGL